MVKEIDLVKHKEGYLQFVESHKNIVLNMVNEEGRPFASCAPFVKKDGKFYIYISRVAEHYRHLENSEWIDAMVIADEVDTPNPFGTERARWGCQPKNIGNEGHEEVFELFNSRFNPKLMEVLRGLDFSLFELTPVQGRYVVGFGLAFDVDIDGDIFNHVVVDKKNKPGVTA
ncbi:HugZ family pyridoxamine 5'-phosphate oxidase [Sporosarcina obsidiansis]|uniref:HugZ family pyridoxamine 5'-phosphate oxidase n=1 Tax=Sporosarcina obsidiansis TaxID=2660748 RepID=UPI00129B3E15|nr:pyridoxamine 5'-phosphate oxidase family protein [Sporosarcina obsidiansis]